MARGEHQIKIRFPDDMVEAIRASAKDNGRSMNAEIVALLREAGVGSDRETLRDKFAGQALIGQLSNSEQVHAGTEPTMSILSGDRRESFAAFLAKEAYVIADAMLAARKAGA